MRARCCISPQLRAVLLAVLVLSGPARLHATEVVPAGFFTLLDEAPLVVTARVAQRSENPALGIVIDELAIQQVLKGTAPAPRALVVQDLVFPSDRPILQTETEWLVALEPLPSSSRYRALPAGHIYLRIRDGHRGVRSAEATAAVLPYLEAAARPGPTETRSSERISALIAALPNPVVGSDAVAALVADRSPQRDLSEEQSRLLASALGNPAIPLEERRALLELIGARHWATLRPVVRSLLAEPTLAPFARRALASFGEPPSADALRDDLQQPDPAARRAALEAAHSLPPAERLLLFTDIARNGGEYDVRATTIDALAGAGPPAVPVLTALLDSPDRRISAKSAKALAAAGGSEALAALSGTFAAGAYDTQVAAVFALRDIGSTEALRILREVRAAPPDPRLKKVIDLALGVNTHGH